MVEILNLYSSISSSDRKSLESKVGSDTFKKGDLILIDGEIQDKLYLVRKGLLLTYFDNGEKRKVIDFAYKNRFAVDIDSFSNQDKSIYCIECMEDSLVEFIHYEDLMNLFDLSKDIERAYRILTEKILCSVLKRNLELSCLSIEERFFQTVCKRPELFNVVQHKYIASYLNINPTNFSKLYHNLAKKPIPFY
ncbi:Crp/Fnr family transcriptional regulator [Chryseobacterium sp.]|uniref:Crp/Fnr family transcriptional regulator n=1 Tax=Chryseobacterium sp. TaxID=1871047 RepID=UPI0011C70089|nr:cyclic nucleotide-binding domain-containing protein [Chryseobacterium sp.]TXF74875.1 Crp/Fnr family transcriptional regulator [Chryseobacterium sp.]